MARLRLLLLAALTICVCACASASARTARHQHHKVVHKLRHSARGARCRRYARKHAHTHCARHKRARHKRSGHRRAIHRLAPARAGSCAGADLTPTKDDLETIRSATLCLINQERNAHGESALAPNAKLEQSAQAHTTDMAFGNYFEHVGPRGDTPLSRMKASGYIYSSQVGYSIGENIAWGTLYLSTPRAIVHAWIQSPPHLANILNAHFHDTAIGVSTHPPSSLAHGQPGGIYTQDFGVIVTG